MPTNAWATEVGGALAVAFGPSPPFSRSRPMIAMAAMPATTPSPVAICFQRKVVAVLIVSPIPAADRPSVGAELPGAEGAEDPRHRIDRLAVRTGDRFP
jgi:hypothetical protein